MKRRVAKKILNRWSREFAVSAIPREVWKRGEMPWKWSTWGRAHRTYLRAVMRRA